MHKGTEQVCTSHVNLSALPSQKTLFLLNTKCNYSFSFYPLTSYRSNSLSINLQSLASLPGCTITPTLFFFFFFTLKDPQECSSFTAVPSQSPLRLILQKRWEFSISHQRFPEGRQEAVLPDHLWDSTKEEMEGRSHTFPVITAREGTEWMRSVMHGLKRAARCAYLDRDGCHWQTQLLQQVAHWPVGGGQ